MFLFYLFISSLFRFEFLKLLLCKKQYSFYSLVQVCEQEQDEFNFCHSPSDSLSSGCKGMILRVRNYCFNLCLSSHKNVSLCLSSHKKCFLVLSTANLRPGMVASSCMANESNLGLHSSIRSPSSAFIGNALAHHSSSVPRTLPSPMRVVSTDKNFCLPESNHSLNEIKFGNQCIPNFHPHSLPEYHDSLAHGITSNSCGVTGNAGLRMTEGTDRRHTHEMNANGHLMELNGGGGTLPI